MGGSQRVRERRALVACSALGAALLLPNLGEQLLWQDEAQTAVIARTVAQGGVPRGSDGRNHFSQELGKEYGEGQLWRWHTWLSFYAVALSFALLGEGTATARLPFALFGVGSIALAWLAGRILWRDSRAASCGALLLGLSVPFLILSRQCRYYAPSAFFALLGLVAYARLEAGRGASWLLFGAATLLFHTHHVYAATLLVSLTLHALLFERARVGSTLRVSAWFGLVNLPWLVWYAGVRPGGDAYLASLWDPAKVLGFAAEYVQLALTYLLPPALLVALPLLLALRRLRGESLVDRSLRIWSPVALLLVFCLVNILGLAVSSPLLFYRYLAPLAPPLLILAGVLLAALSRRSRALAAAVFALYLVTGELREYLHEITHSFAGPIEGIVNLLNEKGTPRDTVAISYGDMPLKFYTPMRVVGGLTGEDLAEARAADWIIPRRRAGTREEQRVRRELLAIVANGDYEELRIDAPDTRFENREHPRLHRFRSAPSDFPRVRVFRRRR